MNRVSVLLLSVLSFMSVLAWGIAKDFVANQPMIESMVIPSQAAAAASLGASVLVAVALAPVLGPIAQGRTLRFVLSFGSVFASVRIIGATQIRPSSLNDVHSPVLLDIAGFYLALWVAIALAGWAICRCTSVANIPDRRS